MFPLRIVTKKYFKEYNNFEAILPSDEIVLFDPFVACAIELSDEDYVNGKGIEYENKAFLLTEFSVRKFGVTKYMVIPDEHGIIEL
jgi:hypothetical protein